MLAKILTEELAKGTTGSGHQEPTSSNWAETWDIFFAKGAMCSTLQEPASTNEQKHETLFSCLINVFCNISGKWSKWHSWAHLWWWSPFMTAIAEIKEHPQLDWKIKHCQDYRHHHLPATCCFPSIHFICWKSPSSAWNITVSSRPQRTNTCQLFCHDRSSWSPSFFVSPFLDI